MPRQDEHLITSLQSSPDECITQLIPVIKGRNVSGRAWKKTDQKRASFLVTKTPENNASKSWKLKVAERALRKAAKQREDEMKQERRNKILEKKERRLENEKRRMENEFKVSSKSAQKMGNNFDLKLKAMSKKQLRQIKKTSVNNRTGVVEFVSAYGNKP